MSHLHAIQPPPDGDPKQASEQDISRALVGESFNLARICLYVLALVVGALLLAVAVLFTR